MPHPQRRMRALAAALLAAAAFVATPAQAASLHYDFDVNWTLGPLRGQTSSGRFEFDAALARPLAAYNATDLLSAASFTVLSRSYTTPAIHSGWLTFDATGRVDGFALGSNCRPGVCTARPGDPDQFFVTLLRARPPNAPGWFATVGDSADFSSAAFAGDLRLASAVDEPPPWALLLAGAGWWLARGRRRAAPRCPEVAGAVSPGP